MSADYLVRLFEHMEWADARVGDALARAEHPPQVALELYAHVLAAELVWLDRVEGREQSVAVWPEPGASSATSACAELAATAQARRSAFAGGLGEMDLRRAVSYTNSAGVAFETPLEEILVHVALHGAYHRGQVATHLKAAGAEPAATDFIAFVRGAPAAVRDDDRRNTRSHPPKTP